MDTMHPIMTEALRPFMGRMEARRYDALEPQRLADAAAHLHRLAMEQAERVNAAIRAIPQGAVCPALLAEIAEALADKAQALREKARDSAQAHLADLALDMRHYQELEDAQ